MLREHRQRRRLGLQALIVGTTLDGGIQIGLRAIQVLPFHAHPGATGPAAFVLGRGGDRPAIQRLGFAAGAIAAGDLGAHPQQGGVLRMNGERRIDLVARGLDLAAGQQQLTEPGHGQRCV